MKQRQGLISRNFALRNLPFKILRSRMNKLHSRPQLGNAVLHHLRAHNVNNYATDENNRECGHCKDKPELSLNA
ncbi:hypothetical protein [Elstera cyanobacteriorum]|uniref:hypothetical protein n=1 Tax=Elstera cyanobacteriorum TaxID=2022747 RepID=UPI002354629A|nr:hypothetical protein [Elstera cyanobacteriorum]MCK6443080.1 hypothetical protein [Elstera cyanobacteriorum]